LLEALAPKTGDTQLDPGLVQISDHAQLLRGAHAPQALDVNRMQQAIHDTAHDTAVADRVDALLALHVCADASQALIALERCRILWHMNRSGCHG